MIVAFLVAALFLVLFVAAERRARSPLLRLELFRNRSFAVASVVAVVGMFSFLGTAYAASIRLGPIQHQSPMRTAFAFLLLNAITPALTPLTSRLLHRLHARVLLTAGLVLMAAGDFLAAGLDVDDRALPSLILPLGLVGCGFALTVSSITATAVNTVPVPLAGMASAATNLLRDFGFTLGPAVIGAVALSQAASRVNGALADASSLDAQSRAAAHEVLAEGGPWPSTRCRPPRRRAPPGSTRSTRSATGTASASWSAAAQPSSRRCWWPPPCAQARPGPRRRTRCSTTTTPPRRPPERAPARRLPRVASPSRPAGKERM